MRAASKLLWNICLTSSLAIPTTRKRYAALTTLQCKNVRSNPWNSVRNGGSFPNASPVPGKALTQPPQVFPHFEVVAYFANSAIEIPASRAACRGTGGKIARTGMPANLTPVDLPATTHKICEPKISIYKNDQTVAWRLASHINFWKAIKADAFICNAVEHGYKLPLITTPEPALLPNNKSARDNADFVNVEISKLLSGNCIQKCDFPPEVVNPLSVSLGTGGKPRRILDLRQLLKY